jgi:hypothetical protein
MLIDLALMKAAGTVGEPRPTVSRILLMYSEHGAARRPKRLAVVL